MIALGNHKLSDFVSACGAPTAAGYEITLRRGDGTVELVQLPQHPTLDEVQALYRELHQRGEQSNG
jgi:hypothetical protein